MKSSNGAWAIAATTTFPAMVDSPRGMNAGKPVMKK
jgi:hypothetical protein